MSRVKQTAILPILREQGSDYVRSMTQGTYPSIAGSDHDRLLGYYNLLDGCTLPGNSTPATHIKNLIEFKQAAPGGYQQHILLIASSICHVLFMSKGQW